MRVIAFLNSKGGVGKSTLCTNVARDLQLRGNRVVILDLDPHGAATNWRGDGNESLPSVMKLVGGGRGVIQKAVDDLRGVDFVLIDGVAIIEQAVLLAISVSDLVVIPTGASGADLDGANLLSSAIHKRVSSTNGRFKAVIVVNRQISGSKLATDGRLEDAVEMMGLPLLAARTSQRVAYTEALTQNTTVIDMDPRGKAAEEIHAITDQILEVLND